MSQKLGKLASTQPLSYAICQSIKEEMLSGWGHHCLEDNFIKEGMERVKVRINCIKAGGRHTPSLKARSSNKEVGSLEQYNRSELNFYVLLLNTITVRLHSLSGEAMWLCALYTLQVCGSQLSKVVCQQRYACIMHTYCTTHTVQAHTKIKFEVEGEHVWCNLSIKDTLKTVRVTSLMRTLSADPKPHRVVYKSTSELGTPL